MASCARAADKCRALHRRDRSHGSGSPSPPCHGVTYHHLSRPASPASRSISISPSLHIRLPSERLGDQSIGTSLTGGPSTQQDTAKRRGRRKTVLALNRSHDTRSTSHHATLHQPDPLRTLTGQTRRIWRLNPLEALELEHGRRHLPRHRSAPVCPEHGGEPTRNRLKLCICWNASA
jgi:hypothetical protein